MIKRILAASALLLGFHSSRADAELITYTESAVVSGTLGGTAYAGQLLTLTLSADSSGIVNDGGGEYTTGNATAMFSLGSLRGAMSGEFAVIAFGFYQSGSSFAGFEGLTAGDALDLTTSGTAFYDYDLATPIGPIAGPSGALGTVAGTYGTTLGALLISADPASTTFTATAQPVPEPSSLALMAAGAILGAWHRRRRGAGVPRRPLN